MDLEPLEDLGLESRLADAAKAPRSMSFRHPNRASVFALLVVFPTVRGHRLLVVGAGQADSAHVLRLGRSSSPWSNSCPSRPGVVSQSALAIRSSWPWRLPIDPEVAALVALVSASDPREFRGEVTLLRALFNRSSIAIAVLAASGVFHAVASVHSPVLLDVRSSPAGNCRGLRDQSWSHHDWCLPALRLSASSGGEGASRPRPRVRYQLPRPWVSWARRSHG